MVIRVGELVMTSDRTNDEGRNQWAIVTWFARFQVRHWFVVNARILLNGLPHRSITSGNTFLKGTIWMLKSNLMNGHTTQLLFIPAKEENLITPRRLSNLFQE